MAMPRARKLRSMNRSQKVQSLGSNLFVKLQSNLLQQVLTHSRSLTSHHTYKQLFLTFSYSHCANQMSFLILVYPVPLWQWYNGTLYMVSCTVQCDKVDDEGNCSAQILVITNVTRAFDLL